MSPYGREESHMSTHSSPIVYIFMRAVAKLDFGLLIEHFTKSQREYLAGNGLQVLCNMFHESRPNKLEWEILSGLSYPGPHWVRSLCYMMHIFLIDSPSAVRTALII